MNFTDEEIERQRIANERHDLEREADEQRSIAETLQGLVDSERARAEKAEARVVELESQLAAHARAGCPQAVTEVAASVCTGPDESRLRRAAQAVWDDAKGTDDDGRYTVKASLLRDLDWALRAAPPTGGEG